MATEWTPKQEKAIEARGMQVLVSAAAGSGKTAVLTERVKNILSDTEKPCSVSELLVVTFTKTAAAEMRERISVALKDLLKEETENSAYIRNQILMLPTADISTIDSFCAKVVRENFSKANINIDFRICDKNENEKIISEAIDKVIDEQYENTDNDFLKLVEMFVGETADSDIKAIIKKLYSFSLSYPFPEVWLNSLAESFDPRKSPNDTVWAEPVYKFVGLFADYYKKTFEKLLALMEYDGKFVSQFIKKFELSVEKLSSLIDAVDKKSWDAMVDIINSGLYNSDKIQNRDADKTLKDNCLEIHKQFRKDADDLVGEGLPTAEEHRKDCERLYPIVSAICSCVKRLHEVVIESKGEQNAYYFVDILHKCIDLLVESDGKGSWVRTSLCEDLKSKYKEILIDEYQDTNEAQNMIFEALSRDKSNIYVVGDVKQSIYRFRLASPGLFMNLRHNLDDYDGSFKPSQITLDANFRSRKGIDESVNYLFESIMSEVVGDIEYNDNEKMTYGAKYTDNKIAETEFLCIDGSGLNSKQQSEAEAEAIAQYIEREIKAGTEVTLKKEKRQVQYRDFAILLRGIKNVSDVYVEALQRHNIPCTSSADFNVGDSKEIRLLISLIKVINNPMLDIPLSAVLLSPLFGFTPDELAEIRLTSKYGEIFTCMNEYSNKSEKVTRFLEKLKLYRNISSSVPVDELVKYIVDDTGIGEIYLADSNGKRRYDNIRCFVKLACDYTKNFSGGLNAFVRYVESAVEDGEFEGSSKITDFDGVKIMTIHKSKGLEFPYVIVSSCSKGFSDSANKGVVKVARETGVGMKIRDNELFTKYETLSSIGTKKAIEFADMSESLRILYVAMTRAREHLVFVCSVSGVSFPKRVRLNSFIGFNKDGKLHPFLVYSASNMSEWLLSVYSRHRDCQVLRDSVKITYYEELPASFDVSCTPLEAKEILDNMPSKSDDGGSSIVEIDAELLDALNEKLSFNYEYNYDGVIAKRSASSTERNKVKREYFASSKPRFMRDKITGADRGTAIHKFLEKCDFSVASVDVASEKDRLLSSNVLNEKEYGVIPEAEMNLFFDSAIIKRLLSADEVLKEYAFSILKKAGDIYSDIPAEIASEEIVVQGMLDCAFIENGNAVLIDYKTDSITDENEYISIYKPQIDIYAEALEKCKGCKVTERYIYSLKLNKFISL